MRRSERVVIAYFAYASLLALILPLRAPIPAVTITLNLTIMAGYTLLIYAHSLRQRALLGIMRDWFPLVLLLLAYREMGWFRPSGHSSSLEHSCIFWDRLVLRRWLVHDSIEFLGPVVPSILEISY